MRVQLQPAFILHTRPFTESSLILEVLTAHHGRMVLMARSVRGASSRVRGILRPFVPLLLSWSGKGEMMQLSTAELESPPLHLSGRALFTGFYLNELMMRLIPRSDPQAKIFEYYRTILHDLQRLEDKRHLELTLRLFEKRFLTELGYGLKLDHDDQQVPVLADQTYQFVMGKGLVKSAIGLLGRHLLAFHQGCLQTREEFLTAKSITRTAFIELLGDKPLKSQLLFKIL
ncbi:MAG: DNA repair protein RecO [Gammaproteobacteria bacterium]